jgi:hypothetical protein
MRLLERDTPISAEQALAQGRDLAGADDATLVDARTAKWTSLRTTDRPVRGAGRRRNTLASAGAAVAVAAIVTAAVIVANLGDGEKPGSGKAGPTAAPRPTTPAQISAAIQKATTARRTYALTVEGNHGEGTEGLNAEGRCQIGAELRTDCDITAGNEWAGDQPGQVVLIGDTGYIAASNDPRAYPVERAKNLDIPMLYYAQRARRLASPQHIADLLRQAQGTQTTRDRATFTYRGRIPIQTIADSKAIGGWYEEFTAVTGHVTFTLATSTDHLPRRLDLNIVGTAQNSNVSLRANYQVTYKDWGRAGNVAKPF